MLPRPRRRCWGGWARGRWGGRRKSAASSRPLGGGGGPSPGSGKRVPSPRRAARRRRGSPGARPAFLRETHRAPQVAARARSAAFWWPRGARFVRLQGSGTEAQLARFIWTSGAQMNHNPLVRDRSLHLTVTTRFPSPTPTPGPLLFRIYHSPHLCFSYYIILASLDVLPKKCSEVWQLFIKPHAVCDPFAVLL